MDENKVADTKTRSRSWMYTINNYTDEDINRLKSLDCTYHVMGKEVGENGTPHLQGCITLTKTIRFSGASKCIKGHLTVPNDLSAARNYCMKDDDFWVQDNRKQGQRSDLDDVCDFIKAGNSLKDTALKFSSTYVKFHSGILQLTRHTQNTEPRKDKPTVSWYYGSTGTGKTRSVYESEPNLWISGDSLAYFNGYENQPAVLFDDFRGGFCKFRELLRLLDRYPVTVNIKFGSAEWNPERIYITSNVAPEACYDKNGEDIQQLVRRIDNIIEFGIGLNTIPRRTVIKGSLPLILADTSINIDDVDDQN